MSLEQFSGILSYFTTEINKHYQYWSTGPGHDSALWFYGVLGLQKRKRMPKSSFSCPRFFGQQIDLPRIGNWLETCITEDSVTLRRFRTLLSFVMGSLLPAFCLVFGFPYLSFCSHYRNVFLWFFMQRIISVSFWLLVQKSFRF